MRVLLIAGLLWLLLRQSGADPSDGVGSSSDEFFGGDEVNPVGAIADAIQRKEGWYPGSRAYRNNNPGNLRSSGDLGKDSGGYGVFSSYEKGRAALERDIRLKMQGHTVTGLTPDSTLQDLFNVYAPAADRNDPVGYAQFVADQIGVAVTDTLGSILAMAGI